MPIRGLSRRVCLASLFATIASRAGRCAPDRPVTLDATDYGAKNDASSPATAALGAAARDIPDSGGTLVVPPGRYRMTGTLLLKSGTKLVGPGATLVADQNFQATGSANRYEPERAMVANVNHARQSGMDHDIGVYGLSFDWNGLDRGDAHAISFRKLERGVVADCTFRGGGDGTAFLACVATEVARCMANGTTNCAYDHWEGTSKAVVHDCVADCARGYGILFTGVGTNLDDHRRAADVVATRNKISGATEAGIWVCSDSAQSIVSGVRLVGNRVVAARGGSGIGATGDVRNIVIEDNTVEGLRGGTAIFSRGDRWHRPKSSYIIGNRVVDCVTPDTSVGLIQALGDDSVVQGNRARGGSYPFLVWISGARGTVADNKGDGGRSTRKYNVTGAIAPAVMDP